MTNLKVIYTLVFFVLASTACEQTNNDQTKIEKSALKGELESALTDTTIHNVIDEKTVIIKDRWTAISAAEPILFSIYGKDNIIKQRPYKIDFIDNYWIIKGTLSKDYLGGTFLMIIDSKNNRIVRITHGK